MQKKLIVALATTALLCTPASANAPDQGDRLVDHFKVCSWNMPAPATIMLRYMCWALNA